MKKQPLTIIFILSTTLAFAQQAFEVKISGEGQPVILLPGFTCPGEVWAETASQLGGSYKTYQFTYAGFGGVAPIEMPWYSTLTTELSDFFKVNQIDKAILIGHSMGGMLAIDLAAKHPGQIEKVILVDALPCIREVIMPHVRQEEIVYDNPYNDQMMAMSDSAFRQTATYMAQGMAINQEKHDLLTNWILTADKKTYVYGYTDLLTLDLRSKLPLITAPVLILAADFPNREVVSQTVNSQFEKLSNKEIKIATSSKHFIMYDQPEWFYAAIQSFLR